MPAHQPNGSDGVPGGGPAVAPVGADPYGLGSAGQGPGASGPGPATAAPALSLPTGGGAIRGMGEVRREPGHRHRLGDHLDRHHPGPRRGRGGAVADIRLGSGQRAVRLRLGAARPPDHPAHGHRATRYADESDVFVLSDVEDLVPVLDAAGARHEDTSTHPGWTGHRYRPRTEGTFARIERLVRTLSAGPIGTAIVGPPVLGWGRCDAHIWPHRQRVSGRATTLIVRLAPQRVVRLRSRSGW